MYRDAVLSNYLSYHAQLICDWASENGPSWHTKFHHIFHICCIITNELLKLGKYNFHHQYTISQATLYSLQNVNIVYRTQHMYHFVMWCILCPLGPFSLAQSHILIQIIIISNESTQFTMYCYCAVTDMVLDEYSQLKLLLLATQLLCNGNLAQLATIFGNKRYPALPHSMDECQHAATQNASIYHT